ncbi:dipeptidase [Enterococcus sp. LJL90]
MKVADMHCDTILKIYQSHLDGHYQGLRENDFQIDRQKLLAGDYLVQNFAIYVDLETAKNPYQTAKEMIACYQEELSLNQDWLRPVTTVAEILANQQQGFISSMLTMEEGAPLQGEISKLEEFYQAGVRMLTLTWNFKNEIGYPNAIYADEAEQIVTLEQAGLTKTGFGIVERMTELGMIVDVSHGSDQLVKDVLATTKGPFVASHSNGRQVKNHYRNLPDDLIKAIANRGGVIGMNYYEKFLRAADDQTHLITKLVDHISYLKNVGGIDCVGLGSDFDGIRLNSDLKDASYLPQLALKLSQAGYSDGEIEKVFSKNVLRMYQDVLK